MSKEVLDAETINMIFAKAHDTMHKDEHFKAGCNIPKAKEEGYKFLEYIRRSEDGIQGHRESE